MARKNRAARDDDASMSTVHFALVIVSALALSLVIGFPAAAQGPIGPFKDQLFSGAGVLEKADGGDFEVVDYQEMRDINGRDQVPERRVKSRYVSTGVKRHQVDETLSLGTRPIEVTRVGPQRNADFTVIFVHGRGGDRRLGANDFSFGGNFNRLKNLVVGNGGTYYSPTVASFDQAGATDIAALVRHASESSAGRPVFLACASMGGMICSGISRQEVVQKLDGIVLLGGPPDPEFMATAAGRRRVPLYLAHGSADSVYPVEGPVAVYRKLHAAGYPVRMTVFNTGSHGTPIRMTDWRKVLNFLLTAG
ncbi:phospholipase [Pseudorhizobium endolithicum]|uniref:Phospholipase n=2 Tax=Pseudorhizobium endolithicum TaxID=1191678 RepID=A0ABN7JY17_9HYPH|nr:phospholipase [Pseudorhizobium endolithicum]